MANGPASMVRSAGLSGGAWEERQLRKAVTSAPGAGKRTRCATPSSPASASTVLVVPKSTPRLRATWRSLVLPLPLVGRVDRAARRETGEGAELLHPARLTASRPPHEGEGKQRLRIRLRQR